MEPRFTAHAAAPAVELWPGVYRRTLVWGERTLLAEITLRQGAVVPDHQHPHEQIGYVVRGRLEFIVEGRRAVLGAGDGYLIPGNAVHRVVALEDSVALDIFAPVREEYTLTPPPWHTGTAGDGQA
jgi:quercetin dioxygenase-like cupin family protein